MELNRGSPPKQLMMGGDDDQEKWVLDSSVNHRGNVPLRASTGAWKASLFIIAIEFSERLSYFGVATSLIIYLTKVIHEDLKTAAKNSNYWTGVTTLMPLVGGFIADAYLGRFWTVLASSVVYVMGLCVLTMSRFVPSLRPEEGGRGSTNTHELVFFVAIYLISVGTGGHKPALESFGADQFDDQHSSERRKKMSFFNWWNLGLCCGLLLGVTVIVYIQDHFGWGVADIVLTGVMLSSLGIFLVGRPFYRYRKPMGSPLTPIIQVFVAAFNNRHLPYPSTNDELYEVSSNKEAGRRLLCHTDKLKLLDKAAILQVNGNGNDIKKLDPWRVATVTKVEEAKLVINMIPIWVSCLPYGICVAQSTTFFIKQSAAANLNVFPRSGFSIPPASIFSLTALGIIATVALYDRVLVPFLRKVRRNERGISILQRIGVGILLSVVTMVTAALVERKRLNDINNNNNDHMSVLWLAPQFVIIGVGDGFALVGLQEYFYDQAPDSMRSLGIAAYLSVIGAGHFLSSLLITLIDKITRSSRSTSDTSWFGKDLNSSRLDYFYWLLAVMAFLNFGVYMVVARRYSYKNIMPHSKSNNAVVAVDDSRHHHQPTSTTDHPLSVSV